MFSRCRINKARLRFHGVVGREIAPVNRSLSDGAPSTQANKQPTETVCLRIVTNKNRILYDYHSTDQYHSALSHRIYYTYTFITETTAGIHI